MHIIRAGSMSSAKGADDWFIGTVRIDPLFNPFAPGASEVENGKVVDWLEHVTYEQYGA